MGGTGVIDRFLEVFTSYIDSCFGLRGGEVAFLSSTLVAIDITLAGLFWALASDEDVIARLIRKTLYVGFFAFLIGNFNTLAKVIFNSFAGLGLKAAGSGLSADQFVQPGRIAQVGIDAGKPILQAASQLMGFVAFFENFVQIVVLLIAWLVVLVAGAAVGSALAAGGLGVAGAMGMRAGAAAVGGAVRGAAASLGGSAFGTSSVGTASPSAGANAPSSPAGGTPPEWAQRMRRHQAMSHGISAAAHAVRSADHGGGSTSVLLSE